MKTITVEKRISKEEAAKLLGLKVYDTALPQQWLDDLCLKLAATPSGRFSKPKLNFQDAILSGTVWCYDGSLLGYPYAMTEQAYFWLHHDCTGLKDVIAKQPAILSINLGGMNYARQLNMSAVQERPDESVQVDQP